MQHDIVSLDLNNAGCTAGTIAVDAAARLLQTQPKAYALVVSADDRSDCSAQLDTDHASELVNNAAHGGSEASALVLSNRRRDGWRAKYELQRPIVRTLAAGDASAQTVTDEAAGDAVQQHLAAFASSVAPVSAHLRFVVSSVLSKVPPSHALVPVAPDLNAAFDTLCVNAGSSAQLDEFAAQLQLVGVALLPAEAEHRCSDAGASSFWSTLAGIEGSRGVRRGERVWQLESSGTGECDSAMWRALRSVDAAGAAGVDAKIPHGLKRARGNMVLCAV